jgi:DNA-binding MarR family transcriptional regulator
MNTNITSALRRAARAVDRMTAAQMRKLGLSVGDIDFLLALTVGTDLSIVEIARIASLDVTWCSEISRRLKKRGLVKIERSGRSALIRLTDDGAKLATKGLAILTAIEEEISTTGKAMPFVKRLNAIAEIKS